MISLNCGAKEDSQESLGLQRSNQSTLTEINSEHSLEGLMEPQYFGHLIQTALIGKDLDAGKI